MIRHHITKHIITTMQWTNTEVIQVRRPVLAPILTPSCHASFELSDDKYYASRELLKLLPMPQPAHQLVSVFASGSWWLLSRRLAWLPPWTKDAGALVWRWCVPKGHIRRSSAKDRGSFCKICCCRGWFPGRHYYLVWETRWKRLTSRRFIALTNRLEALVVSVCG